MIDQVHFFDSFRFSVQSRSSEALPSYYGICVVCSGVKMTSQSTAPQIQQLVTVQVFYIINTLYNACLHRSFVLFGVCQSQLWSMVTMYRATLHGLQLEGLPSLSPLYQFPRTITTLYSSSETIACHSTQLLSSVCKIQLKSGGHMSLQAVIYIVRSHMTSTSNTLLVYNSTTLPLPLSQLLMI